MKRILAFLAKRERNCCGPLPDEAPAEVTEDDDAVAVGLFFFE